MTRIINYTTEDGTHHLEIIVDRLVNDRPNPQCLDSADDARGTRELEWHLDYASEMNEHGKVIHCGMLPWWLSKIKDQYQDEVDTHLWDKYDENQGVPVYED